MRVDKDSSTPDSAIVIAGTTDNVASKFKFTATNEDWTVDKLRIKLGTITNEGSVSKVSISYPGGTASGYLASGYVTFTGMNWVIEKDTYEILTVSADLAAIDANVDATGREIALDVACDVIDKCKATGSSMKVLGDDEVFTGGVAGYIAANTMYLRKSKPTVEKVALGSSQLLDGTKELFRFKVTADAAGAITLKKFAFDVTVSDNATASALTLNTWKLYDTADMGTALPATWSNGAATSTDSSGLNLTNGAGNIYVYLTNEKEIAAGASKEFSLKAKVANSAQYDSVSTALVNTNDTANREAKILVAAGDGLWIAKVTGDTHTDFIWSDKAKGINHANAGTSADWANGYLIKILPTDTVSLVYPS